MFQTLLKSLPGQQYVPLVARERRHLGHRTGNVVGRDGLDQHRGQANRVAIGGSRGDALDELEELRGY